MYKTKACTIWGTRYYCSIEGERICERIKLYFVLVCKLDHHKPAIKVALHVYPNPKTLKTLTSDPTTYLDDMGDI
jgi:hypothetical protein